MKKLNYAVLEEENYQGYLLKEAPEKVLQFGEGGFMRAFIDYFIDIMNEKGGFNGKVAVVQPRGGHMDVVERFAAQDGLYTLILRGQENGKKVSRQRVISSISRCLDPKEDWTGVLAAATQPSIRFVISNTTEAGIAYDPVCRPSDNPPASYPAKLLTILLRRFELGLPGLWILPCELNDHNGDLLLGVLNRYMDDWQVSDAFRAWFAAENHVCSTLVDRIVTGYPRKEAEHLWEELEYEDDLIDTAEVFGLWVIEAPEGLKKELPVQVFHLPVLVTKDHTPYKKRKVRILNGAHTSIVMGSYLAGKNIVRECMQDPVIRDFMNKAIYEEIIPTLDLPAKELKDFAAAVRERFSNPYIDHSLLAISLNSASKWRERILPSVTEYVNRFQTLPRCLTDSFAMWVQFCHQAKERGAECLVGYRGEDRYEVKDDAYVLDFFYGHRDDDAKSLMHALVTDETMWHGALAALPGFEERAAKALETVQEQGTYALMESCLK